MRRILKMLARLYPAAWRERYGAEYEALLDDATPRARDGFDVFWGAMKMRMTARSFVRILLVCSLVGMLGAVGLSFMAPKKYLSETLISVETPGPQAIDKYLVGLMNDWLSPEVLTSIIERENLYPGERSRMPMSDVVDLMRKNIMVRPLQKSDGEQASGFVVEFVYSDPQVAQRVDARLVSGLVAANLHERINNPSGTALPSATFAVRYPASLPRRPVFPKRGLFGAGGLLAGLFVGLIGAAVVGWRRRLTVANG
jgi:hypothetical protein